MNARASENYLAIYRSSITRIIQSLYYSPASRCESADRGRSIIQVSSSSASKSVEIFWAEIYWGRLIFRAESSLIQSQSPDSFHIRYRTWFIRWILVEGSVRTGAGNCPEFDSIELSFLYWSYRSLRNLKS
jgi:hypothetical protein